MPRIEAANMRRAEDAEEMVIAMMIFVCLFFWVLGAWRGRGKSRSEERRMCV
jgi:hypothetical protein